MFDDITTVTLTKSMHGANVRQAVLAQNLANADTPGYKRQSVSFEGALAQALEQDRADRAATLRMGEDLGGEDTMTRRALDGVDVSVTRVDNTTMRVDGNNVDPDSEMSELASNQLAYNTVTALLDSRFNQMRTAISGR